MCRDGPCPTRELACPAPGVRSPDGLHCYRRETGALLEWTAAEAACVGAGGHLASIHSSAENALVAGLHGGVLVWVGLNDRAAEGTFAWSSGEPFNFTSWFVTEPNNSGGVPGEDCVEMPFTTGSVIGGTGWNDRNCDQLTAYVCEDELWPTW